MYAKYFIKVHYFYTLQNTVYTRDARILTKAVVCICGHFHYFYIDNYSKTEINFVFDNLKYGIQNFMINL